MSIHIESNKNDIAKTVIMPGDPKRCEHIALKYLTNVKLVNQVRGMTAYTGYYKDKKITIFPSGMGIPSMGIYSYELFHDYEVDNIIRIGTVGSYINLKLNDSIIVDKSYTDSNYAKIINNDDTNVISSNSNLNNTIINIANSKNIELYKGNIFTTDVFYEKENTYQEKVTKYNVLGVEMESFALFYNAFMFNKKATSLLLVTDSFLTGEKLNHEEREHNLDNLFLLTLETSLKL